MSSTIISLRSLSPLDFIFLLSFIIVVVISIIFITQAITGSLKQLGLKHVGGLNFSKQNPQTQMPESPHSSNQNVDTALILERITELATRTSVSEAYTKKCVHTLLNRIQALKIESEAKSKELYAMVLGLQIMSEHVSPHKAMEFYEKYKQMGGNGVVDVYIEEVIKPEIIRLTNERYNSGD